MTLRTRRPPGRGDDGTTLAELIVAMSITSVSLVIIAASFIAMYRSSSKAQSIGDTSTQVSIAFDRLDTSLRYAAAISQPGVGAGGNWYVEWSGAIPSAADCSQLRFDAAAGQLQQRTWNLDDDSRATDLSGWQTLAGSLHPVDAAGVPVPVFALGTDASLPHQQLTIHLASSGAGPDATTTDLAIAFTALNSLQSTDPTAICAQAGRP